MFKTNQDEFYHHWNHPEMRWAALASGSCPAPGGIQTQVRLLWNRFRNQVSSQNASESWDGAVLTKSFPSSPPFDFTATQAIAVFTLCLFFCFEYTQKIIMVIMKNFKVYKVCKCVSPPMSSSFLPTHQVTLKVWWGLLYRNVNVFLSSYICIFNKMGLCFI